MGSKSGPHSGLLLKNLSRAQFLATKPWPENGLKIRTAFFEKKHIQNHHKLSLGRASRPVQDRSLQAVSLMPRNTLTTQMGQA